MTNYLKVAVNGIMAVDSNYADIKINANPSAYTSSPVEVTSRIVGVPTASPVTVVTTNFTTVTCVILKNQDSTNYIEVAWTSNAHACTSKILPGGLFMISDLTVASNIVLSSAAGTPLCELYIFGT